jgi:AraC-like DNA-binding protein
MLAYQKLKITLAQAQTPEDKIQAYFAIIRYLLHRQHQKAIIYIEEALVLAKTHNMHIPEAFCWLDKLFLSIIQGNTKQMIQDLPIFFYCLQRIENSAAYYYLLGVLTNFATAAFKLEGGKEQVIWYYLKSIEMCEQNQDILQQIPLGEYFKPLIFQGLSFAYLMTQETEKSLAALELATFFLKQKSETDLQADLYHRWAFFYWKNQKYDLAVEYAYKSIDLTAPKTKECFLYVKNIQLYNLIGTIEAVVYKDFAKARFCVEQAIAIAEHFAFKLGLAELYTTLAQVHTCSEDWQQAYNCSKKSAEMYKEYAYTQSANYIKSIQTQFNTYGKAITTHDVNVNILIQNFFQNLPKTQQKAAPALESIQIYEKIAANCHLPNLNIADIAAVFNVSTRTLNRKTQQFFSLSTQRFINFVRLQKAHYLILNTDLYISEIAHLVGFEHLSHFGVSFKKQFGVLPSDLKMAQK